MEGGAVVPHVVSPRRAPLPPSRRSGGWLSWTKTSSGPTTTGRCLPGTGRSSPPGIASSRSASMPASSACGAIICTIARPAFAAARSTWPSSCWRATESARRSASNHAPRHGKAQSCRHCRQDLH
jgi:hypothetical protein